MAQITFTIPDAKMPTVIDAWSEGYQDTIDGQPNPQTKQQFAKQQMAAMIKVKVRQYEVNQHVIAGDIQDVPIS